MLDLSFLLYYNDIVFNWFKNNHKSHIPSDFDDCFLTSKDDELKIGSSFTLPSDAICYVSYKDKIYLSSTEIIDVNTKTLQHLIDKQTKNPQKAIKEIKADLFFVNMREQQRNHNYKDKLRFENGSVKTIVSSNLTLKVTDPKKILSFVLSELALPTARDSDHMILGYYEDFLRGFFLHKKLDSDKIDGELYEELSKKVGKFFSKMGIEVKSFNISLGFGEEVPFVENKRTSFFDEISKKEPAKNEQPTEILVDEGKNKEYNQEVENQTEPSNPKTETSSVATGYCPVCNMKLIPGSKFCHRCGYRIN